MTRLELRFIGHFINETTMPQDIKILKIDFKTIYILPFVIAGTESNGTFRAGGGNVVLTLFVNSCLCLVLRLAWNLVNGVGKIALCGMLDGGTASETII